MDKIFYVDSVLPTYPHEEGFEIIEIIEIPRDLAEKMAKLWEERQLEREAVFKWVNATPNFTKDKVAINKYFDAIDLIEKKFKDPYEIYKIYAGSPQPQTCMAKKGSYSEGQILDQMPQDLAPFTDYPPVIFNIASEMVANY